MHTRLQKIIEYRTNGKQSEFAELMHWDRTYLSKLLRGESIGITPTLSILKTFPELNARWFLFGDGGMFNDKAAMQIHITMLQKVLELLVTEDKVSKKTAQEIDEIIRMSKAEMTT